MLGSHDAVPLLDPLGAFADGLIDLAGDVTATTIVVDDIDEALTELVEEGIVTTK